MVGVRRIDAFVFDLDGTLVDSLPDLVDVTNAALSRFGYPERTRDEILGMVGNGLRALILQALPQEVSGAAAEEAIAFWKGLYDERGGVKTRPYEGMPEALAGLKGRGLALAVLSNKYDRGAKLLVEHFFPGVFDLVLGEGPVPRKPNPQGLALVSKALGVTPDHMAYVGDTAETDMCTAHAVGAFAVGVTWGYQSREGLAAGNPDIMIDSPAQLLEI